MHSEVVTVAMAVGPSKTPRERKPIHWKRTSEADKKKRILNAVLRLVAKHGVHGTTTARIAAAAGVSEPTLYRVYRNKKEVLLAAADAAWQVRLDSLAPAYDPNAIEHIRKMAQYHTRAIQTSPVVEVLYHFAVAPRNFGLLERLRQQNLTDVQQMAEIIEEGKATGAIRPDADSQGTAWRLMAWYWSEATARLFHFEDAVLASGVSTRTLESILDDIAVKPCG